MEAKLNAQIDRMCGIFLYSLSVGRIRDLLHFPSFLVCFLKSFAMPIPSIYYFHSRLGEVGPNPGVVLSDAHGLCIACTAL